MFIKNLRKKVFHFFLLFEKKRLFIIKANLIL